MPAPKKRKYKSKIPFVSTGEDGIIVKIGNSTATLTVDQYCLFVDRLRRECDRFVGAEIRRIRRRKL